MKSLESFFKIHCFSKSQVICKTVKSSSFYRSNSKSKKCRNDLADYSKDTVTFGAKIVPLDGRHAQKVLLSNAIDKFLRGLN